MVLQFGAVVRVWAVLLLFVQEESCVVQVAAARCKVPLLCALGSLGAGAAAGCHCVPLWVLLCRLGAWVLLPLQGAAAVCAWELGCLCGAAAVCAWGCAFAVCCWCSESPFACFCNRGSLLA